MSMTSPLFQNQTLERGRLGLHLDESDLAQFKTLPSGQDQQGYKDSFYGAQRPLLANWTDGQPLPAGLGRTDPGDTVWQRTNNDVAQQGFQQDGWKPLWAEPWVKRVEAQQMYEWNTLGENSMRDLFFKYNMGTTNNNRGAPYVLNWDRQEPTHPIIARQGQLIGIMQ
jgi:hypothetical protein